MIETGEPFLSICVPSRNRQETLQKTVLGLLASKRGDVEFIVIDNSDDGSVMADFIAGLAPDPRLVFLPSDTVVHSMRANWERAMPVARGRFITIIGDDDHVEPDVVDVIRAILAKAPRTEVVAWSRLTYTWPDIRDRQSAFFVSLKNEVHLMAREGVMARMFAWQTNTHVPSCPFTVYHGAVARVALDRVRDKFGGIYFEHAIVDYDNAMKLMVSAQGFAYIDRPMSVLGVSAKSNSAAIGNFDKAEASYQSFVAENGDYETNDYLRDFPFGTRLGVASAILALQQWFTAKYGLPFAGWEENFAKALARECSMATNKSEFDRQVQACRDAFARYRNGQFAHHFDPVYVDRSAMTAYVGLMDRFVLVREDIGKTSTPAEVYAIVKQMLPEPSELVFAF